jgi:hypothetical protein
METCRHPEFIIFGLDGRTGHALLSALIENIRAGQSYAGPGSATLNLCDGEQRVGFRRVHPTQHPLYLGFAMGFVRSVGRIGELEAVQVFWPDKKGKFPFEVGCDLDAYQQQPRLDIELPPSEAKKFMRRYE